MLNQKASFGGMFTVECIGTDGKVKWTDEFHNLVVNAGLVSINTQFFKGVTYTATWYMGIIPFGGTYAATDTMSSHAGWTENVEYVQSTRPTMSFGSATSADPSIITSVAVSFTMNNVSPVTIGGAFVTSDNTKNGTAGTLFSAGAFDSSIVKIVTAGDTLNITYTFAADAA